MQSSACTFFQWDSASFSQVCTHSPMFPEPRSSNFKRLNKKSNGEREQEQDKLECFVVSSLSMYSLAVISRDWVASASPMAGFLYSFLEKIFLPKVAKHITQRFGALVRLLSPWCESKILIKFYVPKVECKFTTDCSCGWGITALFNILN